MRQSLTRGLIASLWLIPMLLPLSQWPLDHFYREWLAAALALAACAAWLSLPVRHVTLPRSALFLLALAAYLLVQGFLVKTPYREPVLGYAMYLGGAVLLLCAAAGLREAAGADAIIRTLCWAALAGAVLGAAIGIAQGLGVPDWLAGIVLQETDSHVRGHLRHASYYADHLLLGVVAAAYLFAVGGLRLWALLPVLALIALSLAFAGSRLTVLVLALLPVYALTTWLMQRDRDAVRLVAGTALAAAIFLLCEWALRELPWLVQRWERHSTLARLPTEAGGMALRWPLWEKALEAFAGAPLLGNGVDSFAWQYFRLLDYTPPLNYTIHSHNLFTESLACFGLIGTALLVAMFGAFAWQYRQRIAQRQWWPVSAMLGVLFLRALLDLNFWYVHLLAPFVVLLGLADQKGPVLAMRYGKAVVAVGVLAGATMLVLSIRDFRAMAVAGASGRDARALQTALESARRNPLFTALVDSIRADAMQVVPSGNRAQLALNSRSMSWRPTPRMVWRQTALLAANGYPEQACRLSARALRVHPRHVRGARAWFERNAAWPAFATLLVQIDALQGGASPDAVCARPAVSAAPG